MIEAAIAAGELVRKARADEAAAHAKWEQSCRENVDDATAASEARMRRQDAEAALWKLLTEATAP